MKCKTSRMNISGKKKNQKKVLAACRVELHMMSNDINNVRCLKNDPTLIFLHIKIKPIRANNWTLMNYMTKVCTICMCFSCIVRRPRVAIWNKFCKVCNRTASTSSFSMSINKFKAFSANWIENLESIPKDLQAAVRTLNKETWS